MSNTFQPRKLINNNLEQLICFPLEKQLTWLMSSGVLELLWPSKASYPALLSVGLPPMSPVQCLASGHQHMWGVVYLAFFFNDSGSSGFFFFFFWYWLVLISKAVAGKTPSSLSDLSWEFWKIPIKFSVGQMLVPMNVVHCPQHPLDYRLATQNMHPRGIYLHNKIVTTNRYNKKSILKR